MARHVATGAPPTPRGTAACGLAATTPRGGVRAEAGLPRPARLAAPRCSRLVSPVRHRVHLHASRGGSMSPRRSVAAAVAMATVSLASAACASPWALKPGEFYSELSGSFYSARSFLDNNDGTRLALGGTLEERMVRSHDEFGWKKRASVWLDLPVVSRTFAGDAGGSLTSTGLGDFGFGIRYGMHLGHAPLAIELGWAAPAGRDPPPLPRPLGRRRRGRYGLRRTAEWSRARFERVLRLGAPEPVR